MHIVLLNDDSLPTATGGAAVIVDKLRRAYTSQGHTVTLVTTHQDSPEQKAWEDDAGKIISIPVSYDLKSRHRMCIHNPESSQKLRSVMNDLKPDAVHAHNLHTYLTYEALTIAAEHTKKIILTAHDTFLVSFARIKEDKKLTTFDHLSAVGRKYSPSRNRKIKRILKLSGTKVIAISHSVKSVLEKNGIAVFCVIHNGIEAFTDPDPRQIESFRMQYNLTGPTILFAGRVSGDKGIGAILSAFQIVRYRIPKAQLLIAGDRERAEKYVQNQEGIIIASDITHDQMPLAYAASNVVTVPSVYIDNFPTVNLEAMAAGKPILGTTFGGTPEVVQDGQTGIIVDPRDTEQFAKALLNLLLDEQKAQRMGEMGRKRIREQFSLEKQVREYLELMG